MMRYPQVPREEFRRRVHIDVDPATHALMKQDRPFIVVSAHFGNMDYAAPVAAEQYRRLTLAAETIKPVELFEHLAHLRSQNGVDLIPYDRAPRKIIEALKRNEIVGFMLDFGINSHKDINTVPVRFFGETTHFPSSPALLAQRYQAPLIVAFARMVEHDEIHIEVEPPIHVARETPREQAQQETMQKIAERFERALRANPEQWYVFRPMWPPKPRSANRFLRRSRAAT
jgi:lauroyl/myristoyl acyltransferase